MSVPYTPTPIVGYNANPPSDDGQQTEDNRVAWQKILDKVTGPLKDAIESIDAQVAASFSNADSLPDQSGQDGKYLQTNAGVTSWETIAAPQVVELFLPANDSIPSAAVEEVIWSIKTDGDPNSIFANNEAKAPYDGIVRIDTSFISDMTADCLIPSPTINGIHIQDFSTITSGSNSNNGPKATAIVARVSQNELVKVFAHNTRSGAVETLYGSATENATITTITFIQE